MFPINSLIQGYIMKILMKLILKLDNESKKSEIVSGNFLFVKLSGNKYSSILW